MRMMGIAALHTILRKRLREGWRSFVGRITRQRYPPEELERHRLLPSYSFTVSPARSTPGRQRTLIAAIGVPSGAPA